MTHAGVSPAQCHTEPVRRSLRPRFKPAEGVLESRFEPLRADAIHLSHLLIVRLCDLVCRLDERDQRMIGA